MTRSPSACDWSVRRAAQGDVPALVRLRSVMFEAMGEQVGGPDAAWRGAAATWFLDQLSRSATFAAFIVDDPVHGMVSAACGTCDNRAPGPRGLSGVRGHVFSIATDPACRRRGHARACLAALLTWFSRDTSADLVELVATTEGVRLLHLARLPRTRAPHDAPEPHLTGNRLNEPLSAPFMSSAFDIVRGAAVPSDIPARRSICGTRLVPGDPVLSSLRPPVKCFWPTVGAMAGGGDVDMAAVGQLLADRGRCRMLLALADGRALPASALAAEAGVRASTASGHLRKLTERGLLEVLATGRYRYYRLAGPEVARLVEVIGRLAPTQPVRSLRQGTQAHALRLARRCYDHIGGRLGVAVTDAPRSRGLIEGPNGTPDLAAVRGDRLSGGVRDEVDYVLTAAGRDELAALGAVLPPGLAAVRCCIDWTEQRHHIAGPLGTAVLDAFDTAGWITPTPTNRALRVTEQGAAGLREHLGVAWPPRGDQRRPSWLMTH